MFYFYPKIYYKISNFDYIRVTDISINARIRDVVTKYGQTSARPYTITDGESPDYISYKIYGTPKYDYIILLLNNITNYYDEWPMSHSVLMESIEKKYGSLNIAKTTFAKYYTSDNFEISKDAWDELTFLDVNAYRVTNYEYEIEQNDKKSRIRLLNPNYVVKFEVDLQLVLSETQKVENV